MVRDEHQLAEVRKKITGKYKLKLQPPFRCDFHDPWGNRIQVVDLHDESVIWLLPYREVQKAGIKFFGMNKLNGKNILITGASQGWARDGAAFAPRRRSRFVIGRATCRAIE